jgi:energy-converting hydrogenase Eha subunit E
MQQAMAGDTVADDVRRRRRGNLALVAVGLSLIVLAFFIAG